MNQNDRNPSNNNGNNNNNNNNDDQGIRSRRGVRNIYQPDNNNNNNDGNNNNENFIRHIAAMIAAGPGGWGPAAAGNGGGGNGGVALNQNHNNNNNINENNNNNIAARQHEIAMFAAAMQRQHPPILDFDADEVDENQEDDDDDEDNEDDGHDDDDDEEDDEEDINDNDPNDDHNNNIGNVEDNNGIEINDGGIVLLEGGLVGHVVDLDKPKKSEASDGDIMLYFDCVETIPFYPNHPVLHPGVSVKIGLAKNTKLSEVFKRYVDFCNETAYDTKRNDRDRKHQRATVDVTDLEFVHCTLLVDSDTFENPALMKDDHIVVRKERSKEREKDDELMKEQKESDKVYFEELRSLVLPIASSRKEQSMATLSKYEFTSVEHADVILDCRGRTNVNFTVSSSNMYGNLLSCHSFLVSKRCPWLGEIIEKAKIDQKRRAELESKREQSERQSVVTIPDILDVSSNTANVEGIRFCRQKNRMIECGDHNNSNVVSDSQQQFVPLRSQDDELEVLNIENNNKNHDYNEENPNQQDGVRFAQINESDDDDGDVNFVYPQHQVPNSQGQLLIRSTTNDDSCLMDDGDEEVPEFSLKSSSPTGSTRTMRTDTNSILDGPYTYVQMPDHIPDAMVILLEYIYTNRVQSLGCEAFEQACRTRRSNTTSASTKEQLSLIPVSPYDSKNKNWPNDGFPTISFDVAIASIALAESAKMHRLSLMCEIAASELVETTEMAVVAFQVCEQTNKLYNNSLPRLRQAATYTILRSRNARTIDQALKPSLKKPEGAVFILPSIIKGITEVIEENKKTNQDSSKRKYSLMATLSSPNSNDWQSGLSDCFEQLDKDDMYDRDRERRKNRTKDTGSERSKRQSSSRVNPILLCDDIDATSLSGKHSNIARRREMQIQKQQHIEEEHANKLRDLNMKRMASHHLHHHLTTTNLAAPNHPRFAQRLNGLTTATPLNVTTTSKHNNNAPRKDHSSRGGGGGNSNTNQGNDMNASERSWW